MENIFEPTHIVLALLSIGYILIKELLLDKHRLSKELQDVKTKRDPLNALKINLSTLELKVVNLEEMINDKLDLIITDLKEMQKGQKDLSERILIIETRLRIKDQRRR